MEVPAAIDSYSCEPVPELEPESHRDDEASWISWANWVGYQLVCIAAGQPGKR